MSKLDAIIEPDADGTLHLPLPPEWRNQPIRVIAELEPANVPVLAINPGHSLHGFGCLRGKIWVSPDFDEPLEDFKEYME